jgi:hypothetical protein
MQTAAPVKPRRLIRVWALLVVAALPYGCGVLLGLGDSSGMVSDQTYHSGSVLLVSDPHGAVVHKSGTVVGVTPMTARIDYKKIRQYYSTSYSSLVLGTAMDALALGGASLVVGVSDRRIHNDMKDEVTNPVYAVGVAGCILASLFIAADIASFIYRGAQKSRHKGDTRAHFEPASVDMSVAETPLKIDIRTLHLQPIVKHHFSFAEVSKSRASEPPPKSAEDKEGPVDNVPWPLHRVPGLEDAPRPARPASPPDSGTEML